MDKQHEYTLVLIKPHACMLEERRREVRRRLELVGEVLAEKTMRFTKEQMRVHYKHIFDRRPKVYTKLEEVMTIGPADALIISGVDIIKRIRKAIGPTDSDEAPEGTIRGDLGIGMTYNVVHASDSPETAKREISMFFPEEAKFLFSE